MKRFRFASGSLRGRFRQFSKTFRGVSRGFQRRFWGQYEVSWVFRAPLWIFHGFSRAPGVFKGVSWGHSVCFRDVKGFTLGRRSLRGFQMHVMRFHSKCFTPHWFQRRSRGTPQRRFSGNLQGRCKGPTMGFYIQFTRSQRVSERFQKCFGGGFHGLHGRSEMLQKRF